jgi:hypothetical protein
MPKPHCDYCRKTLRPKAHPFTLRIELFPAVEPSLEISEAELQGDIHGELERLIESMAAMDDIDAMKQEKLMFMAYRFTLCRACRDKLAAQFERLGPPKS